MHVFALAGSHGSMQGTTIPRSAAAQGEGALEHSRVWRGAEARPCSSTHLEVRVCKVGSGRAASAAASAPPHAYRRGRGGLHPPRAALARWHYVCAPQCRIGRAAGGGGADTAGAVRPRRATH
jgi:hypothetical protein